MPPVLSAALVFAVVVGAVFGLYGLVAQLPEAAMRRRLERRLQEAAVGPGKDAEGEGPSLLKIARRGPVPALDRLAGRTERGSAMARWIEQSGVRATVSGLCLVAIASAIALFLVAHVAVRQAWVGVAAVGVGFAVPFLLLRQKRGARLRRFEEEFPEALDLMARAVRAGHAFITGLKMAAEELREPVGPEFRKTFEEQNYGLPLKDALANLCERVPILDVRFFATAVQIQRETGGNLSEILENLAHVVRERFKIRRQVRVHTAHGRFTGYVLLSLPAVLAMVLSFINPDHMNLLFRERMGQMMLGIALVMQVVGYLWIQRIVKIEV